MNRLKITISSGRFSFSENIDVERLFKENPIYTADFFRSLFFDRFTPSIASKLLGNHFICRYLEQIKYADNPIAIYPQWLQNEIAYNEPKIQVDSFVISPSVRLLPDLEKAKEIAIWAHGSQKRWDGEPYITHPERIANQMGTNIDCICVAWLHDVVEDTDVTTTDLLDFGVNRDVVDSVEIITRKRGDSYLDYILRVKENLNARTVKIADIKDNLSQLHGPHFKDKRDKYKLALWILQRG